MDKSVINRKALNQRFRRLSSPPCVLNGIVICVITFFAWAGLQPCSGQPLINLSPLPDGNMAVIWTGCGTLQVTSDMQESWCDVPNATSPYEVVPEGASEFYRLAPVLHGDVVFMGTGVSDTNASCLLAVQPADMQYELYVTNAIMGEADWGILPQEDLEYVPGTNGVPDQLMVDGMFERLNIIGDITLCPDFSGYLDLVDEEGGESIAYQVEKAQVRFDGDGNQDGDTTGSAADRAGKDKYPGCITFNNLDSNGSARDASGNLVPDNQTTVINGPNHLAEMALLIARRVPIIPDGWSVSLTLHGVKNGEPAVTGMNGAAGVAPVGDLDVVRIFSANPPAAAPGAAFGTAILGGPGGKTQYVFPANDPSLVDLATLKAGDINLYAEGLPRAFAASIRLRLDLKDAGGQVVSSDEVLITVSPLILLPNTQDTTVAYVSQITGGPVEIGGRTRTAESRAYCTVRFPGAVPAGVMNNNIPPGPLNGTTDQWAQDQFQIGYQQTPFQPAGMYVVLNSKRDRPLKAFPITLLGPGFGYLGPVATPGLVYDSLDSFGNLEVAPPCMAGGANYPLGRIYYGGNISTNPGAVGARQMDPRLVAFLKRQMVQAPVMFYSDWLSVGHVDEFMSIVPDTSGTFGWKVLLADPDIAFKIFAGQTRSQGKVDIDHFPINEYGAYPLPFGAPMIKTIADLAFHRLSSPGDFKTVYWYDVTELEGILYGKPGRFSRFAYDVQDTEPPPIGGLKKDILTAFGLKTTDFISVPVLFDRKIVDGLGRALAVTPGMVNGACYQGVFIAPNPFLHNATNRDPFQIYFNSVVPKGLTVKYIDDWDVYHLLEGEVHCSSNDKRVKPLETVWWK
jgi:hypothetical protein